MQYIIIDFKNNNSNLLTGIKELSEEDTVCIMYPPNSNSISFQAHFELMNTKAKIIYFSIPNNKIFIASQLGYAIQEQSDKQCIFTVVSQDEELNSLINFWKNRGIPISLSKKIIIDSPVKHVQKAKQDTKQPVCIEYAEENLLDDFPVEEYGAIEAEKIPQEKEEDEVEIDDDEFFSRFRSPF